jgi:hypothetical protein
MDSAHTSAAISTIAFGASAVALGAGLVLILTAPHRAKAASPQTAIGVTGSGLHLRAAF